MKYIAWGVIPGQEPRKICEFELGPREGLSVNRENVPPPNAERSTLVGIGGAPRERLKLFSGIPYAQSRAYRRGLRSFLRAKLPDR